MEGDACGNRRQYWLVGNDADIGKEIIQEVFLSLKREDSSKVLSVAEKLTKSDLANLLQLLKSDLRRRFLEYLHHKLDPLIIPILEEPLRAKIAEHLGVKSIAQAVVRLDSDDALSLMTSLNKTMQHEVMHVLPFQIRAVIEEGLTFPQDSAARLMQRLFVTVPAFWSVGQTVKFIREADDLPPSFYEIFVVDLGNRVTGKFPVSDLLKSKRTIFVKDITSKDIVVIPWNMDQEDVAYLFAKHDLVSAPVVDDSGRLIGIITIDDIVDVIKEEAEEDIMVLAGVRNSSFHAAVMETGRLRFSWLFLNLLTAILASVFIGFFEAALEQIVMLAILMPIVASMGGNAGTQTMTIAVRSLATGELSHANALRILLKEILVGCYIGLTLGLIIGIVGKLWVGSWLFGGVLALAMFVTLALAGLLGMLIPLILEYTGADPAVGSGVILTTLTDIIAFSVFLGLAALVLL